MDEQLFLKIRNKKNFSLENILPLSVSNFRYASISESGEPKEKSSLTSNANIKPSFSCLVRLLSPVRDLKNYLN
jgi:hypothetical protein